MRFFFRFLKLVCRLAFKPCLKTFLVMRGLSATRSMTKQSRYFCNQESHKHSCVGYRVVLPFPGWRWFALQSPGHAHGRLLCGSDFVIGTTAQSPLWESSFLQIYQNTACITCESYCVPRAAFRSTPERTLYVFPLFHRAGHCFAQTAFCPATGFIKIHIVVHSSTHRTSYIFFSHSIASYRLSKTPNKHISCPQLTPKGCYSWI